MKIEIASVVANGNGVAHSGPGDASGAVADRPLVDAARLASAVRCRRRVWLATAVVGIIGAALLSAASPPQHSATTDVLLRQDSTRSEPSRAMQTDVQLAASRTVAQNAIRRSGLNLSPNELVSASNAISLSDDVLRIRARGPSARQAARRADAIAAAFLDLRREVLERHADNTVDALEERRASIDSELAEINARIAVSSSGTTPGQAPAELLSRRAGLNAEAGELRRRMDDAIIGTSLLVESSRVLGAASADDRSPTTALAANLAAGTVFGLAIGIGWVLVQEVLSGRVRRREDVVAAMATPVWPSFGWIRLATRLPRAIRQRLAGPPVDRATARRRRFGDLARTFRRALPAAGDRPRSLVVVSIDSDWPAAVAVASMAAELIAEGNKVLLADFSEHSELAELLRVHPTTMSAAPIPGTDASLWVRSPSEVTPEESAQPSEFGQLRGRADVELVLVSVNPSVGPLKLHPWAAEAVAVVTAGRTTVEACRWASRAIRASGLHLAATVLVGASRNDDTLGLPGVPHPREPSVAMPRLTP